MKEGEGVVNTSEIVDAIRSLLHEYDPDTQGVALAETVAAWIKDRVSDDAGKIDGSAPYWFDGWINTLLLAYMSAGTVRLSASEMLEIFVHWFPDIGRNDRGDGR